jgi:hypothetical protein
LSEYHAPWSQERKDEPEPDPIEWTPDEVEPDPIEDQEPEHLKASGLDEDEPPMPWDMTPATSPDLTPEPEPAAQEPPPAPQPAMPSEPPKQAPHPSPAPAPAALPPEAAEALIQSAKEADRMVGEAVQRFAQTFQQHSATAKDQIETRTSEMLARIDAKFDPRAQWAAQVLDRYQNAEPEQRELMRRALGLDP